MCSYSGEGALRRLTTLEGILRRPAMYTASGTFKEVVAYFDGYLHGAGYLGRSAEPRPGKPTDEAAEELYEFKGWLSQRLGVNQFEVFKAVGSGCDSDTAALEELRRLLQMFYAETRESE